MAREFLYIVQESAYKTPVASPVVGTSAFYVRLDQGNAFKMRPKPKVVTVPYGGGFATPLYTVSDKTDCKGSLSLILCATTAQFYLNWAATNINAGQTLPWVTTEPAGDLASCSVYHAIMRSDGTFKRRVYLGTKVDGYTLETSEDAQLVRLSLDLTASTPQGNQFDSSVDPTSGTFPAPTDAQLPTDAYLFIHTNGLLSIGSTRAQVTRFKLSSKNKMAGRFFNNRYLNLYRFEGRETTLDYNLLYAASPDDRTSYEGIAAQTCSFALNNSTHSATVSLQGQNVWTGLDDDLPVDDLYFQSSSMLNQYDNSAGKDLSWAFT